MAAQVNFFCFLMYFSVWLAIWSLKVSTFVLIKVLLTYLKKTADESQPTIALFYKLIKAISSPSNNCRKFITVRLQFLSIF